MARQPIAAEASVSVSTAARPAPGDGSSLVGVSLADFAVAFDRWLDANEPQLRCHLEADDDYDHRVAISRELQSMLYDAGWARWGWPEAAGGLGGTIYHRAVVAERLSRRGWLGPTIFEHIEIIGPTLCRYLQPQYLAEVFPRYIAGERAWSQGFSEPEAGSDLAALRTKAVRVPGGYRVSGHKIWTSWAKYASMCLVLVRTGTPDSRHRGLSMMCVCLDDPGVVVAPIRQANGTDELAEVFFDDVFVPDEAVLGEEGDGWRIAMHLLSHERGTLSWFRHNLLIGRLEESLERTPSTMERSLGSVTIGLLALRSLALRIVARAAAGEELGPSAAYNKVTMGVVEQQLFRHLQGLDEEAFALGTSDDDAAGLLQQEYLFSGIVTIYGGSRQMQLTTIANQILGLPT